MFPCCLRLETNPSHPLIDQGVTVSATGEGGMLEYDYERKVGEGGVPEGRGEERCNRGGGGRGDARARNEKKETGNGE